MVHSSRKSRRNACHDGTVSPDQSSYTPEISTSRTECWIARVGGCGGRGGAHMSTAGAAHRGYGRQWRFFQAAWAVRPDESFLLPIHRHPLSVRRGFVL